MSASKNEPRDHHYVPQFYLRSFCDDQEKTHITTLAKHGRYVVWGRRPISGLGYERDFYIHHVNGATISVEAHINAALETPLSQSRTWQKISIGKCELLDESDRPTLFALVRHFQARSIGKLETMRVLAEMANSGKSAIPFSDSELQMYRSIESRGEQKAFFNFGAATAAWHPNAYRSNSMVVMRTSIPLKTSTVPVISLPMDRREELDLPLPGQEPYQLVLPLSRYCAVSVVRTKVDIGFKNIPVGNDVALGLNRYFVGQFAADAVVRHLIADRSGLDEDLAWAGYSAVRNGNRPINKWIR